MEFYKNGDETVLSVAGAVLKIRGDFTIEHVGLGGGAGGMTGLGEEKTTSSCA